MTTNFARITIKQPDSNAGEPELDPRVEAAQIHGVNETGTLAVTEDGDAQFRGSMSVNLTESREQSEINAMTKERNRYAEMLKNMHDENGNLREGANHHKAEVYKKKVAHIDSEIQLALEIGQEIGATRMNQNPAHMPQAGLNTGKIRSGVGTGYAPTLRDIADDEEMPERLREKARAQLKRMRSVFD